MGMEENYLETSGTEMVADLTGGTSIRSTNDLLGGIERIADESATYYLLGYQPEKASDGNWHKLEVKVMRPGMKVRARQGYQATPPATLTSVVAMGRNKDEGKEELEASHRPGGDDERCRLPVSRFVSAPYVLDVDKTGRAKLLVVLELDTSRLTLRREGDRRTGTVDLTLLGMSRDQGKTFPLDERVQIDLDAKAVGRLDESHARASAACRGRPSTGPREGRSLGAWRHGHPAPEVPGLDGPYLATPIVTDRMIVATAGRRGSCLWPTAASGRRDTSTARTRCSA